MLEGIEATVFRTISGPVSPWEALLPAELLRLPEELARVDALLDDPAFSGLGLVTWRAPGQGAAGVLPRAGEDLGLRRAARC